MGVWQYSSTAVWHNGTMAVWQYNSMAVQQYGTMAEWQYGSTAVWHNHTAEKGHSILPITTFTILSFPIWTYPILIWYVRLLKQPVIRVRSFPLKIIRKFDGLAQTVDTLLIWQDAAKMLKSGVIITVQLVEDFDNIPLLSPTSDPAMQEWNTTDTHITVGLTSHGLVLYQTPFGKPRTGLRTWLTMLCPRGIGQSHSHALIFIFTVKIEGVYSFMCDWNIEQILKQYAV